MIQTDCFFSLLWSIWILEEYIFCCASFRSNSTSQRGFTIQFIISEHRIILNAAQLAPPGPLRGEMEEEQEEGLLLLVFVCCYS